MFETLGSFWKLFKAGEAVDDPAKWKSRQISATSVGAIILASAHVAASFGYQLPIDEKSADQIGGGIIAVTNILLTIIANREIGLSSGSEDTHSGQH